MSAEPRRIEPDAKQWPHLDLWRRVRTAVQALPAHFSAETNIEGISATDIFTLNTMLGATIEEQVVDTLNRLRMVWDPNGDYAHLSFVRRPQTFPDLLLQSGNDKPLMGIELKGWYLLSKEQEPSFRYRVTPAACNPQDLLVVVPWALKNVLAGSPMVFSPFVESARYAADKRNHYWQVERKTKGNATIQAPPNAKPYPNKNDRIEDKPVSDAGGNFGRVARYGLMDDFVQSSLSQDLRGIPAVFWLEFIKSFVQNRDEKAIDSAIQQLRKTIRQKRTTDEPNLAEKILDVLQQEYPEV